jgi:hypothetical protein
MEAIINYVLDLIKQYPDSFSVIAGAALSWAPGLLLEQFLPGAMPAIIKKRLTLGITVISAFTVTTVIWHSIDTGDSKSVVGVVSFFAAMCAPYVHIFAAKVLDKYIPWISSVFTWNKAGGS